MEHTSLDLNPNVDYGVTMGTPMDVESHPVMGKPPRTKKQLGLEAIGP